MAKWILVWNLFFVANLSAQTKTIFLQIDTLITNEQVETIHDFRVVIVNQDIKKGKKGLEPKKDCDLNSFPNYRTTLILENDSVSIKIPVDKNGSFITLKNAYSSSLDTIKINSWALFETQPLDTVFTTTEYYKMREGQIDKNPFRVTKKVKIIKAEIPVIQISLLINGQIHKTQLKLTKQPDYQMSLGHGYKSRNPRNKHGEFKKRLTYFYVNNETIRYTWTGEIDLKSN